MLATNDVAPSTNVSDNATNRALVDSVVYKPLCVAQSMNIQDNYAVAVNHFGLIAERYCSLVDSQSALDKSEFLLQVYRLLPELIAEASRLPLVSFDDDENEEQEAPMRKIRAETKMKEQEWGQLYDFLKEKLGDWNLYWMVFDPRTDNEAIHGSLADDIADIYRDLKDGIVLKGGNEVPASEIIFEWRFGFTSHWGSLLTSLPRAFVRGCERGKDVSEHDEEAGVC